ncbi:MAG: hypothetical protein WCC41_16200 [Rhodomicrobium sp.]
MPDFYSGATNHLGCFIEGFSLRRVQSDLPQALWIAVRLNPLTYGVDGLRGALSGAFAFGVATDLEVLGGLTVVLLALGAYLFAKIEV